MQGDLISKQSVIEKMWELYNSYGNDAEVYDELTTEAINREFSRLQKAICELPTAYDVEKIMEQINKVEGTHIVGIYASISKELYIPKEKVLNIVCYGGKE